MNICYDCGWFWLNWRVGLSISSRSRASWLVEDVGNCDSVFFLFWSPRSSRTSPASRFCSRQALLSLSIFLFPGSPSHIFFSLFFSCYFLSRFFCFFLLLSPRPPLLFSVLCSFFREPKLLFFSLSLNELPCFSLLLPLTSRVQVILLLLCLLLPTLPRNPGVWMPCGTAGDHMPSKTSNFPPIKRFPLPFPSSVGSHAVYLWYCRWSKSPEESVSKIFSWWSSRLGREKRGLRCMGRERWTEGGEWFVQALLVRKGCGLGRSGPV